MLSTVLGFVWKEFSKSAWETAHSSCKINRRPLYHGLCSAPAVTLRRDYVYQKNPMRPQEQAYGITLGQYTTPFSCGYLLPEFSCHLWRSRVPLAVSRVCLNYNSKSLFIAAWGGGERHGICQSAALVMFAERLKGVCSQASRSHMVKAF